MSINCKAVGGVGIYLTKENLKSLNLEYSEDCEDDYKKLYREYEDVYEVLDYGNPEYEKYKQILVIKNILLETSKIEKKIRQLKEFLNYMGIQEPIVLITEVKIY